jgi:hypothetical protein
VTGVVIYVRKVTRRRTWPELEATNWLDPKPVLGCATILVVRRAVEHDAHIDVSDTFIERGLCSLHDHLTALELAGKVVVSKRSLKYLV